MATANDKSTFIPYKGIYGYGNNMGWYGGHLNDQAVAQLAYNSGARNIRPSLSDRLISGAGVDARKAAFEFYKNSLGLIDLTAFVGEPNEPGKNGSANGTPNNRETTTFPGCSEPAKTFKGMYEDVWLDAAKTKINPANTLANYLYKTIPTYGQYVKFWEVVNEPDMSYVQGAWDVNNAGSWFKVNPTPNDLVNLKAPVFYYIRMMRVAYEVIKTMRPDTYICTGGLGFPGFLDAILRNTDNPNNGAVDTVKYPLTGGAYFDILSFHDYPFYEWKEWNNALNKMDYFRNSDSALKYFFKRMGEFDVILKKYGYDGVKFPLKQWMCTEVDLLNKIVVVDKATGKTEWGSKESQINFIPKLHIKAQAKGIVQTYKYGMGDGADGNNVFNNCGVYGNLTASTTTVANAPKNDIFPYMVALTNMLFKKTHDPVKSAAMNLPAGVDGEAFKDANGLYTFAVWAKTETVKPSESEAATGVYTIPGFTGKRYNNLGVSETITAPLSGSVSFFVEDAVVVTQPTPTPTKTVKKVITIYNDFTEKIENY